MKKIYAGIGSRDTPKEILEEMYALGASLGEKDWTLRSGHADGADIAFEQGARSVKGKMEIWLPWPKFNDADMKDSSFRVPGLGVVSFNLAEKFHPAWKKLSNGAKKLHARNGHQILGSNLKSPVDFVVCWTKGGKGGGGTGQALRIAKAHDIPIFDLALSGKMEELMEFLK